MRQNISKNIMEIVLCWPSTAGPGASLRVVCTLSQAPCRKLSFLWEWLTEIALGVGNGRLCPLPLPALGPHLFSPNACYNTLWVPTCTSLLESGRHYFPTTKCKMSNFSTARFSSYLLFIIHTSFAYSAPWSTAVLLSLPDAVIL